MRNDNAMQRGGSALVTALALLIVVSVICIGVVTQFARWRHDYELETVQTEQRMVQSPKTIQNTKEDAQSRQNGDLVPEKEKYNHKSQLNENKSS
ncbi:hypothetical protein PQ472_08030 [Lacticaseibacillus pabuli]|uniref:Uncharacterized protein n=1 Tax=Lacticaseibacillus pabuli TaxID=3025672 RepID=A0ABY7WNV8_9LACO|nr:hypothetical protein [Lacticaseibacillus sp. KACC 23028]WDF81873.1 hypothetical protein PQ472_08030 [Lacticaseibacillus sp. KACC 23028]